MRAAPAGSRMHVFLDGENMVHVDRICRQNENHFVNEFAIAVTFAGSGV